MVQVFAFVGLIGIVVFCLLGLQRVFSFITHTLNCINKVKLLQEEIISLKDTMRTQILEKVSHEYLDSILESYTKNSLFLKYTNGHIKTCGHYAFDVAYCDSCQKANK